MTKGSLSFPSPLSVIFYKTDLIRSGKAYDESHSYLRPGVNARILVFLDNVSGSLYRGNALLALLDPKKTIDQKLDESEASSTRRILKLLQGYCPCHRPKM